MAALPECSVALVGEPRIHVQRPALALVRLCVVATVAYSCHWWWRRATSPPPGSCRSRIGDLEGRQVSLVSGSERGTNGERAE